MKKYTVAVPFLDGTCEKFLEAVRAVGMEPVCVHALTAEAECDGLLLPGGADVDPARYGEPVNGSEETDTELDELHFGILDTYCAAGKPVLGICRGHQVLNVYFGGTLHQHMDTAEAHVMKDEREQFHTVRLKEGSFLAALYSPDPVVNSTHHQGIKTPGRDLEVIAKADDGTVEAVIHRSLPVIGVQWHPENMLGENDEKADGIKVFEYFKELCMGIKNN